MSKPSDQEGLSNRQGRRQVLLKLVTLGVVVSTGSGRAKRFAQGGVQPAGCAIWNPDVGGYSKDKDCGSETGSSDADCGKRTGGAYGEPVHEDNDCVPGHVSQPTTDGKDADCGLKKPGEPTTKHEDGDCGIPTATYSSRDEDCGKPSNSSGSSSYMDSDCTNSSGPGNYNADNDCTTPGSDDDCDLSTINKGQFVHHNDGDAGTHP